MKKIVIVLCFALAGVSLLLTGCSKSTSSNAPGTGTPASNSSNATTPAATTSATSGGSSSSDSAAAGPVDMKVKWQVGKQYNMQMKMDEAMDMNVPGQPMEQEMKVTQAFHYLPVKDLDNGASLVRVVFDSQNLDLNQNGKKFSADTTQNTPPESPAAPIAAGLRAMLNAPLDCTVAADGTVQKIDGLDAFTNGVIAAMPNPQQRMMIAELYDEDTLKQYADSSDTLPGHPVNVGDSWTLSKDVQNPAVEMTVSTTCTFKNWEQRDGHNCMHLLVSGNIKLKDPSAATLNGATVTIRNGTITGEGWFDPDLGTFVDMNGEHEVTVDISSPQMSLTQHMTRKFDVSLLGMTGQ